MTANGYSISVADDENVVTLYCDDNCTTLGMY